MVDLVGSSWSYGARSGEFAALNDYGGNTVISQNGGGTFSFQDMYIKGWANDGGYQSGIAGYLGDMLVGQVDFTMGSDWQNIAGNFATVDRVVVISSGNHFLIDDITLNGTTSVPEPATLGIMALGLLGMGALRRRQQQ